MLEIEICGWNYLIWTSAFGWVGRGQPKFFWKGAEWSQSDGKNMKKKKVLKYYFQNLLGIISQPKVLRLPSKALNRLFVENSTHDSPLPSRQNFWKLGDARYGLDKLWNLFEILSRHKPQNFENSPQGWSPIFWGPSGTPHTCQEADTGCKSNNHWINYISINIQKTASDIQNTHFGIWSCPQRYKFAENPFNQYPVIQSFCNWVLMVCFSWGSAYFSCRGE